MTEECKRSAAVSVNDSIYVVGGENRTCLKYDHTTDTWTQLSRPRQKHRNAPAVVWRGLILVAGGGPEPLTSLIEQYDPLTDTWSDWKGELNVNLWCHGMFIVDLCHT